MYLVNYHREEKKGQREHGTWATRFRLSRTILWYDDINWLRTALATIHIHTCIDIPPSLFFLKFIYIYIYIKKHQFWYFSHFLQIDKRKKKGKKICFLRYIPYSWPSVQFILRTLIWFSECPLHIDMLALHGSDDLGWLFITLFDGPTELRSYERERDRDREINSVPIWSATNQSKEGYRSSSTTHILHPVRAWHD